MKLVRLLTIIGALLGLTSSAPADRVIVAPKNFFDLKATSIDGKEIAMRQYKGKKILIVNVASKCGYTGQYKELQELYTANQEKLVILGFPSNEFLGQEPGSNEEIATFCQKNYGVTFPLFEKTGVKIGKSQHPVYQWLTSKDLNGWNEKDPSWNFCKYLIDENGKLLKFFPSKVKPTSEEITSLL